MSHVTPLQSSFNGGELSPRLRDRIDLSVRQIGVEKMLGYLPLLQGAAEACPGTVHIAAARDDNVRIIPYIFNATQSYVVELTDNKARFYTNGVRIEDDGAPYEISTPWAGLDLAELTYEQSQDVLYIYHPDVQTRKLSRTSATTFALTSIVFEGGPFLPRNKSRSITVQASTSEGLVTLTASSAIFQESDVDRLFRMEAVDLGGIPTWDAGMTVSIGDLRQSNGNVYQAMTTGKTGGNAPIHVEGVEWDGMNSNDVNDQKFGIQWAYLHDRFGLSRIAEYISGTVVKANVIRRLPYSVSATGSYGSAYNGYTPSEFDPETDSWVAPGVAGNRRTWRWQFGAFSNSTGWPHCGRVFDERHCVAVDSTIYASVQGDLDNFAPLNELGDMSRDMAFTHALPSADAIRWMAVDDKLLVGTATAEWVLGPSSAAAGIGPGAVQARRQSGNGAALNMPMMADGRVVFVQRSRANLIEFGYRVERDRFEAPELMRYADHIGNRGIVDLAYQNAPVRMQWIVLDDGDLACALYQPSEDALGWATRKLGGGWTAKSICIIPDETGRYDELWIAAAAPDGSGHILRMQRVRSAASTDPLRVMTDAAWIYDDVENPTNEIEIPWLAGETVDVVADAGLYERVTLGEDGKGTLSQEYHQIIAGLPFPAELDLLSFEAGGDNGAALGKKSRINRVALSMVASAPPQIIVQGQEEHISVDDQYIVGEREPLFTGLAWVQTVGEWDRTRRISLRRTTPYPQTITGVMAETTVQQHGGQE